MKDLEIFHCKSSLAIFYREVVWPQVPHDRNDIVLLIIDDVLVINLDAVYERTLGYRAIDQLVYLIHKHGKEKRFIFLSRDGANIALTGIQFLIENTVKVFNLDQTKCLLVCREPLAINGVEVINWDSISYWCVVTHSFLHNIPITFESFEKKFAAWFHRGTFWRLHLARHLYDNYLDDSYLAYQETDNKKMICDVKLFEFFDEELNWAKDQAPIIYDQVFLNREFTLEKVITPVRKP
jgi:hypothetical protein